ncbi:MAG TPA: thiamine pyrophosphate-dependent enzyme, partial [Gemmataceae bacterium]
MLMGEFATAVQNKLPIKVVVCKNNLLGMIKWEQLVMLGNPEDACSLSPIDFAKVAEACGGKGFSCEEPSDMGRILDMALQEPGPVLIEAVVDPNEPPMPPKATVKQALHFAEALARGTTDASRIIRTVFKDKVREMV